MIKRRQLSTQILSFSEKKIASFTYFEKRVRIGCDQLYTFRILLYQINLFKMVSIRLSVVALAVALQWNSADAWVNPSVTTRGLQTRESPLFHKAPQHDVKAGQSTIDDLSPEQQERVKAFLGHQQNVPKIGFAADVRSLIQYNHGFAVMSTNSKS